MNWPSLRRRCNGAVFVGPSVLQAQIKAAVNHPQVRAKLLEGGYTIVANKRDAFTEGVRKDVALWADMVKVTGFKV